MRVGLDQAWVLPSLIRLSLLPSSEMLLLSNLSLLSRLVLTPCRLFTPVTMLLKLADSSRHGISSSIESCGVAVQKDMIEARVLPQELKLLLLPLGFLVNKLLIDVHVFIGHL